MSKPLFTDVSALNNTHHGNSASRCPNCEGANLCAIAALDKNSSIDVKAAAASACWCMTTPFTPAKDPPLSDGAKRRCFCKQCATVENSKTKKP